MFIWGCGHSRDVHKGHAGGAHAHGLDHCPLQRWERKDACFYSPSTPQLRGRDSGSFSQFPVKETEAQRKHLACARSLSPQKVPALVRVGVGARGPQESGKLPCPGEPCRSSCSPARGSPAPGASRVQPCIRHTHWGARATRLPVSAPSRPWPPLVSSSVSRLPQLHSDTPQPTPLPCLRATGPPAQLGTDKHRPRMDSQWT